MCGICGVAFSDNNRMAESSTLQAMNESMIHRGPDGEGFYRSPGIGIAMRRLSIIDLSSGNQPVYNEKKTIAIVCNGEIYNFIELRAELEKKGHIFTTHSDTETVVHCYEEYGIECLRHLRGMFAFALWDSEERQLFCARDRMGIKPLFYTKGKDGHLYFASTIKSIITTGMVDRAIDPRALGDTFRYGFVLGNRTYFKGINSLLPGHYFVYRTGELTVQQYWDVPFMPDSAQRLFRSEREWCEALEEKFIETIRLHLRSDVPVCGWLSAGIDSSAIVKHMCDLSIKPVETFTVSFADARADETRRKKILSEYSGYNILNQRLHFSSDHFDLYPETIWHEERPDITAVHIVQMLLAKETAQRFKVVLTGEGADELFGGYPWYRIDKLARLFSRMPRWLKQCVLVGTIGPKVFPLESQAFYARRPITVESYADLISQHYPDCRDALWSENIAQELRTTDNMRQMPCDMDWLASLDPFERIQYIEIKTRLGNWITHGIDAMSMAHSLEVRVPFLDHELVQCAAHIPPTLKMKYLREKHILRSAMAAHLPHAITHRRKFGLRAPSSSWLSGTLPTFAEEMLSPEYCKQAEYFSPSMVHTLLQRHKRKEGDYTKLLLLVIGTHLWHSFFIVK
ncbi:MAG: asparagine synthase (glutamine-hydrolyzing) [Bacteroidetes bacterium]|nr:asparagine synthase (glutamine-hydrolyzing) [Bacteroidota bacterium]